MRACGEGGHHVVVFQLLLSLTGHDGDIYDRALLAAEAAPYTDYEALYSQLFLTYIQTPLTAHL